MEMSSLLDDTLESLDVLILCTTEGPELSLEEVKMLRLWVESGGALITSAFSNWSAYGHYAQRTVGWLGLHTRPGDTFRPHCFHSLPDVEASDATIDDSLKMLLQGPFGKPGFMVNRGESFFFSHDAHAYGGMCITKSGESFSPFSSALSSLVFYPPQGAKAGGVTGRGRVLVCSNYHWLSDDDYWDGGLFTVSSTPGHWPNQALLLNFIAGSVAARGELSWSRNQM